MRNDSNGEATYLTPLATPLGGGAIGDGAVVIIAIGWLVPLVLGILPEE
jgi:hypothetical protein